MTARPFINRALGPVAQEARGDARIVAILGPRQAGKSTLARALARSTGEPYVTLDEQAALLRARDDPDGFVLDYPPPLTIDEIQRAPQLMLALKKRVDEHPVPGQYLITGSANLQALATIPDALPGRVDYLQLWPLAQAEIEGQPLTFLDRAFSNNPPRIIDAVAGRRAYASRIVIGGYPDAVHRSDRTRSRFFTGLIHSTLHSDARDIWSGDAETTARVLEHLAARSADLLNHASLGRDVGVTNKTLKAHVGALDALYLVRRHRGWSANVDRRLTKMSKAYISDSGLLCHMLGADAKQVIERDEVAGRAFETFCAMELVRIAAASGRDDFRFHHYRDARQHEIDIVVERRGGDLLAIEVKSSTVVRSSDFSTIRQLRADVGSRLKCGIVLHAGQRSSSFGDDLHALPISALWTP